MANLKQSLAAARSRARLSKEEMLRTGVSYVAAGVLGVMQKPNERGEIPIAKASIMGVPGTVVVAGVAKGIAMFAPGSFGTAANGFADAAAIISIANFAQGHTVNGMSGHRRSSASRRAAAARLERELSSRLDHDDDERELAALEND